MKICCGFIFAYTIELCQSLSLPLQAQVPATRSLQYMFIAFWTWVNMAHVRTKGYSTDLLDPTQVESKKCSQIQWPVPSINAEPVDIFLGEE